MDKPENEERTIRLRLYNYRETSLGFFIEPQGMSFSIPPKTTMEVEIEKKDDAIDISFGGTKEDFYFSVDTNYDPSVFQFGKLIYPPEDDNPSSESN